jgi:hypothetical protein
MPFDNLLANRQANSGPGILFSYVQPLENHKNPIKMDFVNANPVVFHIINEFAAALLSTYPYLKFFIPMKLRRIERAERSDGDSREY